MSQNIKVKICGLKDAETVRAAVTAGTDYIGFNFFPKSPRYVSAAQVAELSLEIPPGVAKVGLLVNPDDTLLDEILEVAPLDMIQLHGSETPQRVADVKTRTGLPVIKVVGVSTADDLDQLAGHAAVADQLLVDTKPPKDAVLPGGNGLAFDWALLTGRRWPVPWLLAGGLTPDNVATAIAKTGAVQVDVASGVESAPGVKDADLMTAFVRAARQG